VFHKVMRVADRGSDRGESVTMADPVSGETRLLRAVTDAEAGGVSLHDRSDSRPS